MEMLITQQEVRNIEALLRILLPFMQFALFAEVLRRMYDTVGFNPLTVGAGMMILGATLVIGQTVVAKVSAEASPDKVAVKFMGDGGKLLMLLGAAIVIASFFIKKF